MHRREYDEGTRIMFYTARHPGLLEEMENQERYNKVLATEIPKKYHNTPEVIEAKEAEMGNFIRFKAFEDIEDQGQPRISSRWVITEKQNHDAMKVKTKARLVVRGFQETEEPRSDSPTLSHDSLRCRIMMSITSNEDFEIRSLDVKNAYLQGSEIGRTVFVEPQSDYKTQGDRAGRGFKELNQEVRHHQGGWRHSLDHPPCLDKSQNLGSLRKSIFFYFGHSKKPFLTPKNLIWP